MATPNTPQSAIIDSKRRAQLVEKVKSIATSTASSGKLKPRAITTPKAVARDQGKGPFKSVALQVVRIKAREITREFREKGDEMVLAAIVIDSKLEVHPFGPYRVPRKFTKDGQVEKFEPPLEMGVIPLEKDFPQKLGVAMVVIEDDRNGGPENFVALLHKTVEELKKELRNELAPDPGASVIDTAKKLLKLIDEVIDVIKAGFSETLTKELLSLLAKKDEIFPPRTHVVTVDSQKEPFPGGATSIDHRFTFERKKFLQSGKYDVVIRWQALS